MSDRWIRLNRETDWINPTVWENLPHLLYYLSHSFASIWRLHASGHLDLSFRALRIHPGNNRAELQLQAMEMVVQTPIQGNFARRYIGIVTADEYPRSDLAEILRRMPFLSPPSSFAELGIGPEHCYPVAEEVRRPELYRNTRDGRYLYPRLYNWIMTRSIMVVYEVINTEWATNGS